MADTDIKQNQGTNDRNQTTQHEQAKAGGSSSGHDRSPSGELDKNRQERSAIGGSEPKGQAKGHENSQTGEPGRARSELKQGQSDTADEKDNSRSTAR